MNSKKDNKSEIVKFRITKRRKRKINKDCKIRK